MVTTRTSGSIAIAMSTTAIPSDWSPVTMATRPPANRSSAHRTTARGWRPSRSAAAAAISSRSETWCRAIMTYLIEILGYRRRLTLPHDGGPWQPARHDRPVSDAPLARGAADPRRHPPARDLRIGPRRGPAAGHRAEAGAPDRGRRPGHPGVREPRHRPRRGRG